MENNAKLGKDLIVSSPTGDRLSLNRLRCDIVSEILGVWLAPDGNHIKILAGLEMSGIEWGAKIRLVNSSHHEAWQALHSNISDKLNIHCLLVVFLENGANPSYNEQY